MRVTVRDVIDIPEVGASPQLAQAISPTGGNPRFGDGNREDAAAGEAGNKNTARRNLLCTLAADHVAFSIWTLWPVMALFMPESVYGFSASDKLLLGAVATLVGGCVRVPYTLGIAAFGGRNWTT